MSVTPDAGNGEGGLFGYLEIRDVVTLDWAGQSSVSDDQLSKIVVHLMSINVYYFLTKTQLPPSLAASCRL